MTKALKKFTVYMVVILCSLFLITGSFSAVFAEDITEFEQVSVETETTPETPEIESDDDIKTNLQEAVNGFIGYLKDKYGDDYEYYYNMIIEEWGSIEEYLLSFGEKLPEECKNSWDKFIGWLHEYSVVWVPILAVIAVIMAAIFGKKLVNKIGGWFKSLFTGSNQQSKALIAQSHALKALMGNNEKFADVVKELDETEKELK